MTVNLEQPYIIYVGNDTSTEFAFNWSMQDANELYVVMNDLPLAQNVDYTVEDLNLSFGGLVVFPEPPTSDDTILIFRQTPITQQVDYVENAPFPADVHEDQLDKDTRILQEFFFGGRGTTGVVDLGTILGVDDVEVTNTAGTNAILPSWECIDDLAGVFHGEVTTVAPVDQSPTNRADGYIWWVINP